MFHFNYGGADFSLLRANSYSHPQANTLRDLGINSSSSAALTSTLLRHFSSMQKPWDSMTAVLDDHGMSDDMGTEIQLDVPVLPPQQSLQTFLMVSQNFGNIKEKRKKAINADIAQLQKQAAQLSCECPPPRLFLLFV